MNDLRKNHSSKKIEYTIGFILMAIYIFTSYVAVDITISSNVNTICLYLFVGWGLLIALLYGMKSGIPKYNVWCAIFMVASIFCMAYSREFKILSGHFYVMIVNFLLTYFIFVFVKKEKDFYRLAWIYSLSSFAMVMMLQFTGNLVGSSEERLGGEIVGNANTFAFMIMFAVFLQLWLLVYNSNGWLQKLLLSTMLLYNMYALALSAGRKFFLLPFVFMYLLLILKVNKKGKRNVVLYTIISAIIAVVAFNMVMKIPVLYEAIGTRLESTIDKKNNDSEAYYSSKIREEMREDAMEQWEEKPIFGYGFDSYKYRAREIVGHFYYSHCNYAEMLYNGGIVYFCVYYLIYILIFREWFLKKNVNPKYRTFALGIAIVFFVLDYGAVTYSATPVQIALCLALKVLTFEPKNFNQEDKTNGEVENIN